MDHTRTDTALFLDMLVRQSDRATGLGPDRANRRVANAFYSDERGHFDAAGMYHSKDDNQLLDMVPDEHGVERAYLTMLGLFCLLKRQHRLSEPTPLFANLQVSDGHNRLRSFAEIMCDALRQLSASVDRSFDLEEAEESRAA